MNKGIWNQPLCVCALTAALPATPEPLLEELQNIGGGYFAAGVWQNIRHYPPPSFGENVIGLTGL